MAYLVLYGSQNLSNKKFLINNATNLRSTSIGIQSIQNARFAGSTIVDKKINGKSISMNGVIQATDTLSLQDVMKEYQLAFNQNHRFLRVSTNYHVFTPMIDSLGWQVNSDTTNIEFDEEVFQYGEGSVRFNADVSIGTGSTGIYTDSATKFDISSYGNGGNFEFWVYLTNSKSVSSLGFVIGSDVENFLYAEAICQYDGTSFGNGWNYISIGHVDMGTAGIIDPYSFGSVIAIYIGYDGEMIDTNEFRLGGVIWQEEDRSINYKAYISNFIASGNYYEIDHAKYNLEIFAYEGVSESTGDFNTYASTGNASATTNGEIVLDGTYDPLPVITIDINSATNVSGINFTNITTEDSVEIIQAFVAGEKLIIDTNNRMITKNGEAVDYDDVLPRFELGKNDIQVSIITTGAESVEKTVQNINLIGEI